MAQVWVRADGQGGHRLEAGGASYPCQVGRSGITASKREGDGATPVGCFPLRLVYYRPDRLAPPSTRLPLRALTPQDGWCDDPAHPDYNRPVALPFAASHEALWRDDGVYDLIVVLGHNDDPPRPGLGSAIFLHLSREDGGPTAGCVALTLPDLLRVLADAAPGDALCVDPSLPESAPEETVHAV